ncbi:DUF502 domain-containing protein [Biformimicrobium ophioploci]|uniref:DUF502 domain-containing protein n=1 Tax=Biformimicrobium ophioploci TaxID=3036711 RepID=A0ABQ6LY66_9GAMM|nr:DUF502 domain-containing protein [Microbulbifer sp. NKW57]GMG86992.1 hypothetical protein MNKW57_13130 [Microbulbifer sp. NKW57]
MKKVRTFLSLTLLGGLGIVLPIVIFVLLAQWLFSKVSSLLAPASAWVEANSQFSDAFASLVVFALILSGCFLIGLVVKTGIGRWVHTQVDYWLARLAPGYKTIREIVSQFLGGDGNQSLLSGQVAKVRIHGPGVPLSVTAIVTSEHEGGECTVYVPTAPIPTSGFVYHVPRECVEFMPHVSVEAALRTVVACGAGSNELFRTAPRVPA